MDISFDSILNSAEIALTECLNLKRSEQLLVICDPACFEIGKAFYESGVKRCKEAVVVMISPRKHDGNDLPEQVKELFPKFDVAVVPTSRSISSIQIRENTVEKGTRIATLPGITPEIFVRTMNADWRKVGAFTRKIAAHLSAAPEIRVSSELGTDLVFKTGENPVFVDDGRLSASGAFGNIPSGEAYLAPDEGTAEGTIVIDGSMGLVQGPLQEPFVLRVKDGRVVKVEKHLLSADLEKIFIRNGQLSRTLAEFGVGTLDSAVVAGNTLEDKKAKGSVHFALGDNASIGGTVQVPIHIDAVVKNPTIWLGSRLWIEKGNLL